MASRANETVERAVSCHWPATRAEYTPTRSPKLRAMTMAQTLSASVAGSLSVMRSSTGRPSLMLRSSPVNRPRMLNQYCFQIGSSRWNCLRKLALTDSEIFGFSSPHGYGLPGVRVMRKNEMRLMKKTSTSEMRRRRTMKVIMGGPPAWAAVCRRTPDGKTTACSRSIRPWSPQPVCP